MTGDPGWDAARARWRSAADQLWSTALVDADGYRRAARGVGDRLAELRRAAATREDLLAAAEGAEGSGDGLVTAAACAVRADEIEAERGRRHRAALVAAARDEGRTWVVLEEGLTRSVSLHLPTGLALVVEDDPYRDRDPHGLGEAVLATGTGELLAGEATAQDWFATRAARDAALATRRAEIGSLDGDGPMVSDER